MKILSDKFIKSFNGKIINIHPSLLPKYKGLNTYKKVLENKEIYSGCTVHYVTKKLDSGKIILQKKFLVAKNETEESLKLKTLNKEYLLYSQSIISIFK
jgi:folate-dependent phosphoribosylglycinamide formyltransferase PurN|tara:strand:+ start:1395 stop:1691 length:297 start_codon:yes stop_codon:yes gene_type:complete